MENWRKFEEQDKNRLVISKKASAVAGLDPSSEMGKVYDRIEDVTRNLGREVAPSTLETVKSAFKDSEIGPDGKLVIANKYIVSDKDNLSDKSIKIMNGKFFLDTVDNVHGKQLGLALENMNEEEILKLISEEVDRMISEGLLEEGFKDKMIKFLSGLTLAGAVLGGMPGEARADLDPVAAKTAVVKVMNQKAEKAGLKDSYGFDLQFQEVDPRLDDLGDALSDLTKASDMDDAKIVDKVANSILINLTPEEKGGDAPASVSNALEVGIETTRETAKEVKKQKKGQKKAGQAKFTNYEGAVANAYNGMQLAFSQGDEAAQNKAVDELFDTLDAAEKAGALDGKAGQAKKLLGKGDIQGFKKLMGY